MQITPHLPLPGKRSPDGATTGCSSRHLIAAYYPFIDPRKDERLSWPGWLTYSGRFTHTSGYPSAVGQAQDRERPTFYHCATQLTDIVFFFSKFQTRMQLNEWKYASPK